MCGSARASHRSRTPAGGSEVDETKAGVEHLDQSSDSSYMCWDSLGMKDHASSESQSPRKKHEHPWLKPLCLLVLHSFQLLPTSNSIQPPDVSMQKKTQTRATCSTWSSGPEATWRDWIPLGLSENSNPSRPVLRDQERAVNGAFG